MKDLEVRQRKWILKYSCKNHKIDAEIARKLAILKTHLWDGDIEPFRWWVSGLFGVVPGTLAILRALEACLKVKDEQKCGQNILCLFSAIRAIEYFGRIESKKCKVLLYEKLDKIPTGYIHLFDLSSEELENGLKSVLKTHGIKEQEKFLIKMAETTPELPVNNHVDLHDPLFHKAEAEKHAFLAGQIKFLNETGIPVTNKGLARVQKFAKSFFTPAVMRIAEKRLVEIREKYEKTLYTKHDHKGEQMKTLAAFGSKKRNSAVIIVQEQMLKVLSGIFPDMGRFFSDMLRQPAQVTLHDNADELYRRERELFNRRKRIRAIWKTHQSDYSFAFEACKQEIPDVTLSEFDAYRKFQGPSTALDEVAKQLGFESLHYAKRAWKQASRNAEINAVWAAYLAAAYPKLETMTAANVPDSPPIKFS